MVADSSPVLSQLLPFRAPTPINRLLKLPPNSGATALPSENRLADSGVLWDWRANIQQSISGHKAAPKFLERYLGKPEAEQFLSFQKGTYAT